jgi:hypothetical protein
MTLYRNAILMPYQMDNANDGGFIRSRGTSENSAIFEIGMWDDAGAGETIQFNYYPTTSTVNPTYSISVPKKTGTIALTSDLASYLPLSGGTITGNLTVRGTLTASDGNLDIYSASGGASAVIFEVQNSLDVMFNGGLEYFFDARITAPAFNNTSDLRKKTIMGDVPMNLYNVANAPLFKFTWKDEKKYSGQHIGSAAQYWQTVLPELVSIGCDADMTLAMQYDVIALASAITVAKTVVNHEERIILLERENEALKKEIADLKSA